MPWSGDVGGWRRMPSREAVAAGGLVRARALQKTGRPIRRRTLQRSHLTLSAACGSATASSPQGRVFVGQDKPVEERRWGGWVCVWQCMYGGMQCSGIEAVLARARWQGRLADARGGGMIAAGGLCFEPPSACIMSVRQADGVRLLPTVTARRSRTEGDYLVPPAVAPSGTGHAHMDPLRQLSLGQAHQTVSSFLEMLCDHKRRRADRCMINFGGTTCVSCVLGSPPGWIVQSVHFHVLLLGMVCA